MFYPFFIRILFIPLLFIYSVAIAKIPPVQQLVINPHVTAWAIEDHYLPIVSVKLAFKYSGTAYDPADKAGIALMTASLLDEGAGDMDSLRFKERLEELAITLDLKVDRDYFTISIKTLSSNLEEALKLLQLALQQPRFDSESMVRVRSQLISMIKRQEKEPEYIATRKLMEAIFGTHPYGRPSYGNIPSLSSLTEEDLRNFIKTHLTLDRLVIGVAGDISPDTFPHLLDKYISFLPEAGESNTNLPGVIYPNKSQLITVDYPVPQNTIMFGLKGVLRDDPLFYPAYVTNYIIGGGGFESRLMQTIREEKGLAYSVSSSMDLADRAGLIVGTAATRAQKSHDTMMLIHDVLSHCKDKGITEQELQNAKQYLTGSFALKLITNNNLADFLIAMQIDHLGIDFLNKRNDYINGVTLEQVNHMVNLLVTPDRMTTVVVGKKL
jgi:zinc protease